MSERISVGDLVCVVRGMPCCNTQTGSEGMFFTVTNIQDCQNEVCIHCKMPLPAPAVFGCPGRRGIDLIRLKRIPPLSSLDSLQTDEPIRETA